MFLTTAVLTVGMIQAGVPGNLTAAERAFERMEYVPAGEMYEAALRETPSDPDLLWRMARLQVCMAEVAEDPARLTHLDAAEGFARHAIQADSSLGQGYTWLAAALGYRAYYAGTSEQVPRAWEILDVTGRALALNPRDDVALSIRGSLYRALANAGWLRRQLARLFVGKLPPGGFEDGEQCLLRAIEIAPDVMRHRYELGVLYLDWGREEEGVRQLELAGELPVRVAIDRPRLAKIRELLEEVRAR